MEELRLTKFVYHIDCRRACPRSDGVDPTSQRVNFRDPALQQVNCRLHEILKKHKEMISTHNAARSWDFYKKLGNEYEFVHNTGGQDPAVFVPVSRSFHKLYEIFYDFRQKQHLSDPAAKLKAAFLCEAPGGMIEAFWKFRQNDIGALVEDDMYAISLCSRDRKVPTWHLRGGLQDRVVLSTGADGTGDMYRQENADAFVDLVGESSCDLVTADGGFDFSYDFSNQEAASVPLLKAEIKTALRLQKTGGTLVLKAFEISRPETMALIYDLTHAYDDIFIVKPLTSRPCNAERYVICTNFHGDKSLGLLSRRDVMWHLTQFNMMSCLRQSLYIKKTIMCMSVPEDRSERLTDLHQIMSEEWKRKYSPASQTRTSD